MAKSKRKNSSSKPTKRLVCDNADKKSPIQQRGMNHAQLTLLIYFTFFMSRQMELSRAVANGPSTTYCSHKFISLRKKKKQYEEKQQKKEDSTVFDDSNQRPDDSPAFDATIFGCDETDWKIVQVRHQTSSIRVVLTLITGLFLLERHTPPHGLEYGILSMSCINEYRCPLPSPGRPRGDGLEWARSPPNHRLFQ